MPLGRLRAPAVEGKNVFHCFPNPLPTCTNLLVAATWRYRLNWPVSPLLFLLLPWFPIWHYVCWVFSSFHSISCSLMPFLQPDIFTSQSILLSYLPQWPVLCGLEVLMDGEVVAPFDEQWTLKFQRNAESLYDSRP